MAINRWIWNPEWETEKKVGVAVTAVAAFSTFVVLLTFVSIVTIETNQKLNSKNEPKSASNLGKYILLLIS